MFIFVNFRYSDHATGLEDGGVGIRFQAVATYFLFSPQWPDQNYDSHILLPNVYRKFLPGVKEAGVSRYSLTSI
jgi:hypothetical protein